MKTESENYVGPLISLTKIKYMMFQKYMRSYKFIQVYISNPAEVDGFIFLEEVKILSTIPPRGTLSTGP